MNKDTGGHAFPCPQDVINQNIPSLGMTLRDYFAAKAIHTAFEKAIHNFKCDGEADLVIDWDHIAWSAFEAADAMLKARES